jgi:hypothetical protein
MGYTHGKAWTEEMVIEAIMRVVNGLGLSTFPTHSEMNSFYGNHGLTVKVSKSGGTKFWAEKLNLPIKQCESETGNDYELLAIQLIKEYIGLNSRQTKPRYPYDIVVDENIKIDVKVSYPFKNNCNAWANTFNLEKKDPTCDIFILFCLNRESELSKTLIIPSCVVAGQTQIGVGKESKYNIYIDNWKLIKKYDDFYRKLIS